MKLTRAASYAFHAIAYLAAQDRSHPIASHIIAQGQGIPERFLLKVLKPLVSIRVLSSIKGPNGGYRLARAPKDITMLEILEAVDGPIRGQAPLSIETQGHQTAVDQRLEQICNQAADVLRKQLDKVRLQDLVAAGKHR